MKWISFPLVAQKFRELVVRFPFAMAIAVIGAIAPSLMLTEWYDTDQFYIFINTLITAVIAFPWVVFVTLLAEKYHRPFVGFVLQGITALLFIGCYFLLPTKDIDQNEMLLTQLGVLTGIGVILLFVLPFDHGDAKRLWRSFADSSRAILIALLFGVGIAVGLTLSFLAVVYLFQLKSIEEENWVAIIWLLTIGVVTIWTFLALLPNPAAESRIQESSNVTRRFLLFVWLPLVTVFFVILYVYFGRILIFWDWPNGGVVGWILAFSIAGILAYINSQTLGEEYHRLKRIYFHLFFAALAPLMVVYGYAIGFRLQQYGVTQERYLIVLAGVWLIATIGCYVVVRSRFLPAMSYVTVLLFLIAIVGPWNMFTVSLSNQTQRLEELLERNAMLVNGKIVSDSEHIISMEDERTISSTLYYILEHDGVERIQPWFEQDLGDHPQEYEVKKYLTISETTTNYGPSPSFYLSRDYQEEKVAVDVEGYASFLSGIYVSSQYGTAITIDGENLKLDLSKDGKLKISQVNSQKNLNLLMTIDLTPIIQKLLDQYGKKNSYIPASEMTIEAENNTSKFRLLFRTFSGEQLESGIELDNVELQLIGTIK